MSASVLRVAGREEDLGLGFEVLGPVEVSVAGEPVPGMAPRHRAVLGYMLLHPGMVLSTERLIDAIWGATPPDTARAQIHAAITAIRRVLRAAGAASALRTRAAGYVIGPEAGQADLAEFTERVAAAQKQAVAGDLTEAAATMRSALALWRGEPLAGVQADYVDAARARLTERRLVAFEHLADWELTAGRHEDLIDELTAQVAAHPLRERLSCLLMRALHQAGSQADALAVARAYRSTLADQQGLDPGRAFVALEQAILRDEADHAPTPATSTVPSRRPVNYLPYDTPDFAGRTAELERLTGTESAVLAAIDGMAGIGKTALAIRAAHLLAGRHPDGQLFVDLQAHTAGQAPVEPGAALEVLLRQLGVPAGRIPAGTSERAALWRAELADRRVVVVLDNAADTDHVRPLLPGAAGGSLMLITSQRRLTGLDGARALSMDLLSANDSVELFRAVVGQRADAEPLAVMDVLQLCGFLPLAVRIAAARLHHRPRWTVGYLAGRLRDERRRLAELSTADRGVTAAFTLSYQYLEPDQQRLFRLLGLHPGRDIAPHAAAALADLPLEQAETLLEDLLDAHILLQHEPGRYTFHSLLREHARTTVAATETGDARDAALDRLFQHYLHTASMAVDLCYPYGRDRRPRVPAPSTPVMSFADSTPAEVWLEAERANVIAAAAYTAEHGWSHRPGQFATTLRPYLDGTAHRTDALAVHAHALQASRTHGDQAAEGVALVDLGWANWQLGRYEEADDLSRQALEVCRSIGDRFGESRALNTLGTLTTRQGAYDRAHPYLRQALGLCREIGNRVGEAHVLGNLAICYQRQGRFEEALDHHREALELHRTVGNRGGEARVLDHLGLVYQLQRSYAKALQHHRQALEIYRSLGNRSDEAASLNGLAEAARGMGDPAQAVRDHAAALTLAAELGNLSEQARALNGLAQSHRELGATETAREYGRQALDLYVELGLPDAVQARDFLAGLPTSASGPGQAP